jgi:hypothetical protein
VPSIREDGVNRDIARSIWLNKDDVKVYKAMEMHRLAMNRNVKYTVYRKHIRTLINLREKWPTGMQ